MEFRVRKTTSFRECFCFLRKTMWSWWNYIKLLIGSTIFSQCFWGCEYKKMVAIFETSTTGMSCPLTIGSLKKALLNPYFWGGGRLWGGVVDSP